jgi:ATP-dependent DNA helicase DinG
VQEAFLEDGILSQATQQFQPRTGQTDMALAVADVISEGGSLVVEAGTGVGKTFAYLVPALLSGERVLLSTATKALQDQLFARDIPRLIAAFNLPIRLALLKGRSNYLCTHRMQMARQDASLPDRHVVRMLAKVETWALTTHTGDLAELPGLDERSALIPWITSNRENCLGSQCPAFKNCHVNNARRDALAADIVVINHHLFFADLAVRESGMAELLPSVRVVVFDEAHQLNETGVNFLGQQLSTSQLLDLTRDLLATGLQLARGFADWQGLASALELSGRDLRLLVGQRNASTKIKWTEPTPEGIAVDAWQHALQGVYQAADNIAQSLETVVEVAPDFLRLQERMVDVMQRVSLFAKACDSQTVRWLDVTASQMRLMQAPLDIADTVRERLLKQSVVSNTSDHANADGKQISDSVNDEAPWLDEENAKPRSWVFTSATLGDEPTLRWFTEPCGLESAQVLRVESPFDYPNQASMFVPKDIVRPNDPAHSAQVARLASGAVRVLGGKTLVLTTTLRALRAIGDAMKQQLEGSGIEVLMQGEWPKRELMARFQDATPEQGGCVLVASATFWEGFDVPGDALQLVIIDKLPFPPPNDPIVEARGKRLETQGRSPFNDFFVPEAVIALKQGAGRLIRRETDRGVLVVCDNRLATTGYGKRLLAAMPNMRQLHTQEELHKALQAL